jgi:hypothetical protein
MNIPTKTIITPTTKSKIVIKEWITGADREYIDSALTEGMEMNDVMNQQVKAQDIGKKAKEMEHRELEKFVVSITHPNSEEIKDNIVKNILNLPEQDVEFIKSNLKKNLNLHNTEKE